MLINMKEETSQLNVFCWDCAEGSTNIKCTKCIRHFHEKCVENYSVVGWICNECKGEDGDFP